MKLKTLIIDDEPDNRSVLRSLLTLYCPSIEICAEASNAREAYEMIVDHKPHVIFLDIQMPGNNGFSILKKFTEIPFEVVFVTSYDRYAIEAIRFSALDYLLKPVEISELRATVRRIENTIEKKQNRQMQLVNLVIGMENENTTKKLAVHQNDSVVFLPLHHITHLEAERNYTWIFTEEKEKYASAKNLGEFEEMFEDYPQFLRISKSHIVNLEHINDYSKGEPCLITVNHHFSFEISRRKKNEILGILKHRS
jgi:two-component system, LytTR family, response regulator